MKLARTFYRPKPRSLLRSIIRSFIDLWVNLWHRNNHVPNRNLCKAADLNKEHLQEKRVRSDSRVQSNSIATPDGNAQKLGNDLWREFKSIATKVCSQMSSRWNEMLETQVETCIDWLSFNFRFKYFLGNFQLKTIIYCITDQSSIRCFQRSALIFKFSDLTFLRSMSCSMSIEQELCEEKKVQHQIE